MRARLSRSDDGGFLMVALLVAMAVTAVWMSTMLPAWRQQAQRQKETDLIFRGEQYARAIALYWAKNSGALPMTIDDLVQQRYLRKKWKDPITGEDFMLLGGGATSAPAPTTGANPFAAGQSPGGQVTGGISGVYSASTDTSIRVYRNAQQYNQWIFSYNLMLPAMGLAGGGAGGRGGRGGDAVGDRVGGGRGGRGGIGRGDAGGRSGRGGGNRGGGAGSRGGAGS